MKVWIIEYCDAGGNVRDCYPDFCYSRSEAKRIAPRFMADLAACDSGMWVKSWRIAEEEIEPDFTVCGTCPLFPRCGGATTGLRVTADNGQDGDDR